MVSLEKLTRLAMECQFDVGSDFIGPDSVDLQKVRILGLGTKHDVCASTSCNRVVSGAGRTGDVVSAGACHAFTPDGRCVTLFKTLYTNACQHQCNYCPNSSTCNKKTIQKYTPEELAGITLSLYKGNYIEGLFLSSGVGGEENRVMEEMLDAVRLLRERHKFKGYVHMKILPGTSFEHVKQAVELVDRVSVNVECPSKSHMSELSSTKDFENDILQRQRFVRDLKNKKNLASGQTTQFVVGAAEESDREIFARMLYEYKVLGVKRAYFSAFSAVKGTVFEKKKSQPRWRETRLYQLDWLHRVYEFDRKEIHLAFDDNGFLGNMDPKTRIALGAGSGPVDPNEAGYEELIRVPGIGPTGADKIIKLRKRERIKNRNQLKGLGVAVKRARTFLVLNGWRDSTLARWSR
jgi:predicted DNA-binding helix-hairpin-helix protein